jgi:RimJ/RimL family protein N-acetyltransferase
VRDTPDYGDAMTVEVRLRPFEQGEFAAATEQEAEYDDFGPKAGFGSQNPIIGIWLLATHRGRGIGTVAQRQLVDLFFQHTPTNRVEAGTDPENLAEQRALEKAGMTREGTARGAQWRDGGYRDVCTYAVLRAEWT